MKIWKLWLSDKPLPDHFKQYTDTWSIISGGEIHEVTMDNVGDYIGETYFEWVLENIPDNYTVLNHFIRYILLYHYGGIYLDLDVEVIKDSKIWYNEWPVFFFETIKPFWVNNHVMVCKNKRNEIYFELCDETIARFKNKIDKIEINTGPGLITDFAKNHSGFHWFICEPEYTTPWNWNEKPDRSRITENTIAVHHFAHSWKK